MKAILPKITEDFQPDLIVTQPSSADITWLVDGLTMDEIDSKIKVSNDEFVDSIIVELNRNPELQFVILGHCPRIDDRNWINQRADEAMKHSLVRIVMRERPRCFLKKHDLQDVSHGWFQRNGELLSSVPGRDALTLSIVKAITGKTIQRMPPPHLQLQKSRQLLPL